MKRKQSVVLEVRDLQVRRGKTMILNRVSWRVERGQHWVVLGANGSGKTSLLSALTGYLTPSGGEIAVLGRRYGETDWRELRKHIGLVSSSVRQMMPESEPALDTIVFPVGAGGLISGAALVAKTLKPEVTVFGVQAERTPGFVASLAA